MKCIFPLIVIMAFIAGAGPAAMEAQGTLPDSVIFKGSRVDVGQTFRTATATGFGHMTVNSYFRDVKGIEHLAYIDNYKLYYLRSSDDGESWTKEQVVTGHEGDIYICALTADTNGKVFIAFTAHDLFNYANPSGITNGSQYFLYDAYCVNNLGGSWTTELVALHEASNAGPKVAGLFVDAGNNVHLVANRYGWYSYGGIAWEWVRSSSTDTWGTVRKIVEFTDAGIDRVIYDTYTIVPDQQGNVTLVACRMFPPTLTRLFYVRYNGSTWSAPVTISDTVAVAWNRFDAVVDTGGHTYVGYMKNDSLGMPALRVMKDFQPPETASLALAPGDTLYYFRLHCSADGLLTMYAWIKNQNVHIAFSRDAIHWTDPVEVPNELVNYTGGTIIRTDTRLGDFTEYCKQMLAISGPRSALPYGPDTLFYGSFRLFPRITQQYPVNDKWNMVSVPLDVADHAKAAVFPTSVGSAFAFDAGYTTAATLENGRGYWLKFDGVQSVSVTGFQVTADTIDVAAGWNMVGSIGVPVPAASVGSIPGGLVSSNFFGFDIGYATAATIEPGKGYWVKIAEAGKLVLSGSGNTPVASRLRMELEDVIPPAPPNEEFSAAGETPAGFTLGQNYPNPFNPSTLIRYEVPRSSHVSLSVFDVLGREVATLVDEVKPPGAHAVSWDASGMTGGVYISRMTAGSFTQSGKLLLVR
jgi:hypothetical protein